MSESILFRKKIKSFVLVEVLVSLLLISILALAIFRFFTYFNQQYYHINRVNNEFLSTSNFIMRFKKDLDYAQEVVYSHMSRKLSLRTGTETYSYTFEPDKVVFRHDDQKITYAVTIKNLEVNERDNCPFVQNITFDLEAEKQEDLVFSYKKRYFRAMDYQCQ